MAGLSNKISSPISFNKHLSWIKKKPSYASTKNWGKNQVNKLVIPLFFIQYTVCNSAKINTLRWKQIYKEYHISEGWREKKGGRVGKTNNIWFLEVCFKIDSSYVRGLILLLMLQFGLDLAKGLIGLTQHFRIVPEMNWTQIFINQNQKVERRKTNTNDWLLPQRK